jgi:hypothetical protein
MDIDARERLLSDIASGEVALRDLAGLGRRDVEAILSLVSRTTRQSSC